MTQSLTLCYFFFSPRIVKNRLGVEALTRERKAIFLPVCALKDALPNDLFDQKLSPGDTQASEIALKKSCKQHGFTAQWQRGMH